MDWTWLGNWLSTTSVAVIGAILLLAVVAALLAGRLARGLVPILRDGEKGESLLTSSVLGLLALMLSFTFALAADRFDARRLLVLDEANAIGTMYLRTQLLEEPHRSRLGRTLIAYTDNRIALAQAKPGEGQALLAANDRLIQQFWSESAAAFPSIRDLDFSSTFYDSVNRVIDMDASRKAARLAHVPPAVFALLFVYVIVSAALLGYAADNARALAQTCLFLFLLMLFLLVIVDIDQPTAGGIRESQGPMERMRATLSTP